MIFSSHQKSELGHVEELNKKVTQKLEDYYVSEWKVFITYLKTADSEHKKCFLSSYQKCWFMLHQQKNFSLWNIKLKKVLFCLF